MSEIKKEFHQAIQQAVEHKAEIPYRFDKIKALFDVLPGLAPQEKKLIFMMGYQMVNALNRLKLNEYYPDSIKSEIDTPLVAAVLADYKILNLLREEFKPNEKRQNKPKTNNP